MDDETSCTTAPHNTTGTGPSDAVDAPANAVDPQNSELNRAQRAVALARQAIAMRAAADVQLLRAAAEYAAAHPAQTDPTSPSTSYDQPGAWVRPSDGCPPVCEFAPLSFAQATGMREHTAGNLMLDALDLQFRLPKTWTNVSTGIMTAHTARAVAAASRDLNTTGAAMVDTAIAEQCHSTAPRALKTLALTCKQASEPVTDPIDPATTWSVWDQDTREDGTAVLQITADRPDVTAFTTTLNALASHLAALGDDRCKGARLSTALGLLAQPAQAAHIMGHSVGNPTPPIVPTSPTIHLTMHIDVTDQGQAAPQPTGQLHCSPAQVTTPTGSHLGVVATQVARRWLTTATTTGATVTIQPVVDTNAYRANNAYTPSPAVRRIVMLRDQTCVFPGCDIPAGRTDLDHIEPFDPTRPAIEQTTTENLACLCRKHHRAKTHHGWTYRRHPDGTGYTWTAPPQLPRTDGTIARSHTRCDTTTTASDTEANTTNLALAGVTHPFLGELESFAQQATVFVERGTTAKRRLRSAIRRARHQAALEAHRHANPTSPSAIFMAQFDGDPPF